MNTLTPWNILVKHAESRIETMNRARVLAHKERTCGWGCLTEEERAEYLSIDTKVMNLAKDYVEGWVTAMLGEGKN